MVRMFNPTASERYVVFARDHHYTIQVMSGKIKDEFTRWLVRTGITLRTGESYPTIYYIVNKKNYRPDQW